VLGSGPLNRTKELLMFRIIDRPVTFRKVKLPTTDPNVKVDLNKCSGCNALLEQMDTRGHKQFHDELRKFVQQAAALGR
jgi:hypothetical protein